MEAELLLTRALEESAMLLVADRDGSILKVSERTARLLGVEADSLKGLDLATVLAGKESSLDGFWPTLREGSAWMGDIARAVDDRIFWLRATVLPVFDAEKAPRFIAIIAAKPGPLRSELDLYDAVDLYENAPYAFHSLDRDGLIVKVNATWLAFMRYSRNEVEGRLRFEDVVTPESLSVFRQNYEQFKSLGFVRDLEFSFRRKDGSTFPGLLSATAVKDDAGNFVRSRSIIVDLSERRRAEEAAMLIKDRLVEAVECVQDPFAIYDSEDRLVSCNSAFRRHLPATLRGAVIGIRFEELLDNLFDADALLLGKETREQFKARRLAYRANPVGSFEEWMSDGSVYRIFERRTTEGGTVSYRWDIAGDIRRERELREARELAESANAAKSEFLSSMSHELRTPLNAVLGFSQLLQRDNDPALTPRQLGYLKHVLRGGEHLLRLIDDVLDLARVESGAVPISPEPVAIDSVLREVLTTLAPMAENRGIELHASEVPPNLPLVMLDRTRLSQILLNFGSNAIKYNRPAGRVSFVANVVSGRVRVSVIDTGIGVAADKRAELFQAFHRLGQETGPIEGTGIGLAISKRLAEIMGGNIGVDSVEGKGSEFWVDFAPHGKQEPPRSLSRPNLPALRPSGTGQERKQTVLYVEDNPANVALMQELLATLNRHDLLTAPTAEIGIELARARRPNLIILDINLPGISGYEALEQLRRWPETRDIPVLALSASAMERDVRRALDAGFGQYLTKPVKLDELVDALESWLS